MPDELTPREVARELGVTVRTVQRWIADGRLPASRVGGRMRVARSSLASVIEASRKPGAVPVSAQPIRTLLIANRGEIVERVARTARRLGIRTVGVHAPDDRPPTGLDLVLPVPSYLDISAILDGARRSGADAVHPGYGFLSENPEFAEAVIDGGLTWVGPPPGAIAAMGDKAAARRQAAGLGVPVVAGYDSDAQDDGSLLAAAERIGYPLLVKPAAGGGGKGMRPVRDPAELPEALKASRREAAAAFGDHRLILERLLEGARHVEIQVLFDAHGRGIHLGERDCSTQRRSQKIVEEAPAPTVSAEVRQRLGDAARAVAADAAYVGAGTVEFLLVDDAFFFLEMNTRLQVEHPVTEAITGRDLVADQLRIAAGEPLSLEEDLLRPKGHAFEARVYAEDPDAGFLPASGRLLRVRWPHGVRLDTGVREGDLVSDRYDPLIAKVIAHGPTRAEALTRLRSALDGTLLLGVRTNLRFLRWLLDQPVMRDGEMRVDSLAGLQFPEPATPSLETWQGAGFALLEERHATVWSGGWRTNAAAAVRLRMGDEERRVELPLSAPERDVAEVDGVAHADVEGQSVEIRLAEPPTVEEAVRHATAHAGGRALLVAPMPGRVIEIRVDEGRSVATHATVVVVEAMKMEHAVTTPLAGVVDRIHVSEGQQVERGQLLAEVAAHTETDGAADLERDLGRQVEQ